MGSPSPCSVRWVAIASILGIGRLPIERIRSTLITCLPTFGTKETHLFDLTFLLPTPDLGEGSRFAFSSTNTGGLWTCGLVV